MSGVLWEITVPDEGRPRNVTNAFAQVERDGLSLTVEYCGEGASVTLSLREVELLRDALDRYVQEKAPTQRPGRIDAPPSE